tara:strand:+ start:40 stop:714 length:675 start_codon:yes stop_codon:yes gene_type:complete
MKEISKAIIAVMQEVKGMEKNSNVGSGKNGYNGTKDQDVKEVFNTALAKNGLCILPTDIQEETNIDRWEGVDPWSKSTPKDTKMYQSVFTKVRTKYLLLHTSGESIELAGYGHGVDPQDKGAGKATTYALKNCLLYTFLTPVGKIDDTETTHSEDIEVKQASKPTLKQKPELVVNSKEFFGGINKHTDTSIMKEHFVITEDVEKEYNKQLNVAVNCDATEADLY